MSFDIVGKGGHMCLTTNTWATLLNLAQASGWEPMGTKVNLAQCRADAAAMGHAFDPHDLYWSGSYLCTFGDVVTDQDAKNLADAPDRFLSDYPADEALVGHVWAVYVPDYYLRHLKDLKSRYGQQVEVTPPQLDVATIWELADFCGEGTFMIRWQENARQPWSRQQTVLTRPAETSNSGS